MKYISIIVMLLMSAGMNAQTVSVDEAKNRVLDYMNTKIARQANAPSRLKKANADRLRLAYVAQAGNEPQLYVFNNADGGFVVAGAQEMAEDVLAYSYEGTFDYATVNPNLKYWIDSYERQIQAAVKAGIRPDMAASPKTYHPEDVSPLLQTLWDQSAPYNNMCPKIRNRSCYTGCVATAMSQVMKYYEWPVMGTGSYTYTDYPVNEGGCGQTLTADFGSHTYDWANMCNKYTNVYSDAQANAVAQLMSDAGISVNMQYTDEGSGAFTEDVTYAFVKYFGYDEGIRHAYRDCYTDREWDNIIYNELINGRPVMYGGNSSTGEGHSFVCDGYQVATDKYHFNWGWSGMGDCYCSLSAVRGYGNSFNYLQDIVYGIKPAEEGTVARPDICTYETGELDIAITEKDGYTTYKATFGKVYDISGTYLNFVMNFSWKPFDVLFNIMYQNAETGKQYYAADPKNEAANQYHFNTVYPFSENQCYYENITVRDVKAPKLPAGTYKVKVVYKDYADRADNDESLWQELRCFGSPNYIEVNVESVIKAPVATAATDITANAFTANWNAIEGADSYTLELTAKERANTPAATLFAEHFASLADLETEYGSTPLDNLDEYTSTPGWTGSQVYTGKDGFKLGSGKTGGKLVTPVIETAEPALTLNFTEKRFNQDETKITVSLCDAYGNAITSQDLFIDGVSHTVVFTDVPERFRFSFESTGPKQRYFITDVEVTVGTEAEVTTTLYEGITDTKYAFSGLDLNAYDYSYRVQGVTTDGDSKWSNVIAVDNLTAIDTIAPDADRRPSRIFNLNGQRLSRLQPGINIVGGRKVLVK